MDSAWDMQIYDIFVWRETKGRIVSDESQVFFTFFWT